MEAYYSIIQKENEYRIEEHHENDQVVNTRVDQMHYEDIERVGASVIDIEEIFAEQHRTACQVQ